MTELKKEEIKILAVEKLSLNDLLRLVWQKTRPHRVGLVLGFLAVAATLVLILTGQKTTPFQFESKKQTEVVNISNEKVLNQSTESVQPQVISKKTIQKKTASETKTPNNQININTATVSQLESLPYVGPVMARRIIDYRQSYGPFKNIESLDQVNGIGPKTLEKLRPLITVD